MSATVLAPPRLAATMAIPQTAAGMGAVFSINFVRQQNASARLRRVLMLLMIGYLALCGIGLVALITLAGQYRLQSAMIRGALPVPSVLRSVEQEVAVLHDQAARDLSKLQVIAAAYEGRFPTAGKLAAVTNTLPARTWITALSVNREERWLRVEARYVIDAKAPYELPVQAWIGALEADASFAEGLKRLELGSSSRLREHGAELYAFTLNGEWR